MAIPPIISNFPLFRIFKTDRSAAARDASQGTSSASSGGDTVSISSAAKDKLDLSKAREAATHVRQYLEKNPVALGLDPAFE